MRKQTMAKRKATKKTQRRARGGDASVFVTPGGSVEIVTGGGEIIQVLGIDTPPPSITKS